MRYHSYHIPTLTFPNELTTIRKGIFAFKSKERLNHFHRYSHTTCIVVDSQIHSDSFSFIKDYILILNIFRQEHASVQWYSQFNKNETDTFEDFDKYFENHFENPEKPIAHIENLYSMELHLLINHRDKYPFIDILNKFSELDSESFIKKCIQFISIANPIIMTTNRIYDNALFESAMLFQAFEAILNEFYPVTESNNEICLECKKNNSVGIRTRTKIFLKSQGLFSKEIISAMMKIVANRNKFFHQLKGKTHIQYTNEAVDKIGDNYISFENEIKYADATIQTPSILKLIIIKILFDKLGINNH